MLGLPLQKWGGVAAPGRLAPTWSSSRSRGVTGDPGLTAALAAWDALPPSQQTAWATAYADALAKAPDGDPAQVAAGDYGPVPVLADGLPARWPASAVSRASLTSSGTLLRRRPDPQLLLLSDGAYLEDQRVADHLGGDQWGMMNEIGNYPGQPWMWLYTFWYQVQAVLHLGERRRPGLGADDGAHPRPGAPARSSPACAPSRAGSRSTGSIWRDYYRRRGA